MSENTYEKLVSKAKQLDYIIGPGMKLNVQESVKKTHSSELEKICGCSGSTIGCEDYNLSLLADFLYNLDKQASQDATIGTPDALALYFKNKRNTDFIAKDKSGKKYISLTAKGVALFKEIWNSGRQNCYHDEDIVTFSKLENEGFNLMAEKSDFNPTENLVSEEQATLVKNDSGPSILVQNSLRSAGLTDEYKAPDDSIVGSRRPLRGSYLKDNF
jgi:hypothetical protein